MVLVNRPRHWELMEGMTTSRYYVSRLSQLTGAFLLPSPRDHPGLPTSWARRPGREAHASPSSSAVPVAPHAPHVLSPVGNAQTSATPLFEDLLSSVCTERETTEHGRPSRDVISQQLRVLRRLASNGWEMFGLFKLGEESSAWGCNTAGPESSSLTRPRHIPCNPRTLEDVLLMSPATGQQFYGRPVPTGLI